MSQIIDKVKEIIVEKLDVEESEVTLEASFTDDLNANSLDAIDLIMEFEKKFGITMDDYEEAEKINTVGDAINYIKSKI